MGGGAGGIGSGPGPGTGVGLGGAGPGGFGSGSGSGTGGGVGTGGVGIGGCGAGSGTGPPPIAELVAFMPSEFPPGVVGNLGGGVVCSATARGTPFPRIVRSVRLKRRFPMIILGIILAIIGFVAGIPILWTLGIILVVVGLVLMLLGSAGHAVGGRRHYY